MHATARSLDVISGKKGANESDLGRFAWNSWHKPIKCTLPVGGDEEEMAIGKIVDVPDLALNAALAGQLSLGHGCFCLHGGRDRAHAFSFASCPLRVAVEPRHFSHSLERECGRGGEL